MTEPEPELLGARICEAVKQQVRLGSIKISKNGYEIDQKKSENQFMRIEALKGREKSRLFIRSSKTEVEARWLRAMLCIYRDRPVGNVTPVLHVCRGRYPVTVP
jgi:hypothetical protein